MKSFLSAVAILFLLAAPTRAEGTLDEAIAAYDAGDYEKAYELFLPLAEAGDAEAQYSIGFMLARGEGVPEDEAEAIVWLDKAVVQGHVKATYILGLLYANGDQTPRMPELARKLFAQAADQCHADAAAALSIELFVAAEDDQTRIEAFAWAYVSLHWGSLDAQSSLGAAYLFYGKDLADQGKVLARQIELDLACTEDEIVHN